MLKFCCIIFRGHLRKANAISIPIYKTLLTISVKLGKFVNIVYRIEFVNNLYYFFKITL